MRRFLFLAVPLAVIATATTVLAASFTQALAPGDTLHVTCSTQLVGTLSDVSCATPTPKPLTTTWMVPTVTGVTQGQGYTQYCDMYQGYNLCGTWPAAFLFRCVSPMGTNNLMWKMNDDDNSGVVVKLAAPVSVSGIRFDTFPSSTPGLTYSPEVTVWTSANVNDVNMSFNSAQSSGPTIPPAIHFSGTPAIANAVWGKVQMTFPAVVLHDYVRIAFDGDGSFFNVGDQFSWQVPSGTAGTACAP